MEEGVLLEAIINTSEQNEERISKLLYILMFIIITSFLLRDSFSRNIPTILFFSLYFIGFLLLKRKELLLFFIFLVPLSNGPLLYYLNVVFGIFFLLKNLSFIRINKAVIAGFILLLWESLHLLPNSFAGYNESIIKFLGFGLCLIVITLSITNNNLSKSYKSIIFSWTMGFGSFCTILLIKYIYNFGLSNFSTIVRRFGWIPASLDSETTTLLINPNALGNLVILTVFCLLTLLKYEKKYSISIIIGIVYFISFGLMSGSRSFLLVFFIVSLIYLIEVMLNIKKNKKMFIFLLIAIIITSFIAINYMESTLNMITKRIQNEDITGSRFDIYKQYYNAIRNSPYIIFGSGMQDNSYKYGLDSSTHNFFIEIISIWGIIGLVIVFIWFSLLYKSLKISKNISIKKKTFLHYLPLLGLFLYAQTGQFFISYYHTLPILIIAFGNIKYFDDKIKHIQ